MQRCECLADFLYMNSWSRTMLLTRQSFGVLARDKKLLVFPVAAAISAICVSASFMRPLLEGGHLDFKTLLWLFLWYYFHYFVILFFNSALTSSAHARMTGQTPSLKNGFKAAVDRLLPISMWTLAISTFGVAIRVIEGRSRTLAMYLSGLIGLTWTFATYFVGPVLMFEEAGIVPAVKRSVEITRTTWGDQLTNHASFGFVTFLLAIPGLVLAAAGLIVSHALLLPALVYGLMLSVVLSAARAVFTVALYRYATTGEIPAGFSGEVMAS